MNPMSFFSWLQHWSPSIALVLTLAGWVVVLWSNYASSRHAVLLATRNQARTDITAALERYLSYLHDILDPATVAFNMANVNALGIRQNRVLQYVPALMAQVAAGLRHDPRLGAGGLQILKGYLPLFPELEEVIVHLQFVQLSIEEHLERYFEIAALPLQVAQALQTAPTEASSSDHLPQIQRTDEELREIWSQIGLVNDLIEWLNYAVLASLVRGREPWMRTGNPESTTNMKRIGTRLCCDRKGNLHVLHLDEEPM